MQRISILADGKAVSGVGASMYGSQARSESDPHVYEVGN